MEKQNNTILCIAEILSQGRLQLQVHGWTTQYPQIFPLHPPSTKNSSLLEKQHFIHLHLLHFQSPYDRLKIQGKQVPLERNHKYTNGKTKGTSCANLNSNGHSQIRLHNCNSRKKQYKTSFVPSKKSTANLRGMNTPTFL